MQKPKNPNWEFTEIGNYFRIKHGFAFKGEFFTNSGDYILLTPGNFQPEGGLKLKGEREKYYDGDFPSEFLLNKGDLLVVMTDLIQNAPILGGSALIKEGGKYLHNQRLGKVVELDDSRMDKFFLYHLMNFREVREQIKASATGSTVRHTAPERIYKVKAYLPPLPVQHRIADILSAYDDLIENNTRRILILEQMAQTIYQEWFGKVNKESLPKGWELKPFSDLVDIDPTTPIDKEIEKPFVGMNALSETSMIIDLGLVEMRTGNSGAKFQNRDVLFPRITPSVENGKGAFVQFLKDEQVSIGSTEIIVFREKDLNAEYIYFLSREHEFRGNAINSMVGASGRQRVQQKCFDSFMIAKPPKKLLEDFADIVSPMFKITHALALKNAKLRETQDLILPRLISGEVEILGLNEN